MTESNVQDQKQMTLWAAECAEHVLSYFEQERPGDMRPRLAIEAARAWVKGELKVSEARTAAFDAHDAAREVKTDAAIAAARAAGHAAATVHVITHAPHAAEYAVKAAEAASITGERKWQKTRDQVSRM